MGPLINKIIKVDTYNINYYPMTDLQTLQIIQIYARLVLIQFQFSRSIDIASLGAADDAIEKRDSAWYKGHDACPIKGSSHLNQERFHSDYLCSFFFPWATCIDDMYIKWLPITSCTCHWWEVESNPKKDVSLKKNNVFIYLEVWGDRICDFSLF